MKHRACYSVVRHPEIVFAAVDIEVELQCGRSTETIGDVPHVVYHTTPNMKSAMFQQAPLVTVRVQHLRWSLNQLDSCTLLRTVSNVLSDKYFLQASIDQHQQQYQRRVRSFQYERVCRNAWLSKYAGLLQMQETGRDISSSTSTVKLPRVEMVSIFTGAVERFPAMWPSSQIVSRIPEVLKMLRFARNVGAAQFCQHVSIVVLCSSPTDSVCLKVLTSDYRRMALISLAYHCRPRVDFPACKPL